MLGKVGFRQRAQGSTVAPLLRVSYSELMLKMPPRGALLTVLTGAQAGKASMEEYFTLLLISLPLTSH